MKNQNTRILHITNKTLTLGHQVYQISNLTRVSKYEYRPKSIVNFRFIIVTGVLGLLFIPQPELSWLGFIFILLSIAGIIEKVSKKNRHALRLESNGIVSGLIASTDEKLIDDIIDAIIRVMNHQDRAANYTFNIAEGDIIEGDKITQNGVFSTGVNKS